MPDTGLHWVGCADALGVGGGVRRAHVSCLFCFIQPHLGNMASKILCNFLCDMSVYVHGRAGAQRGQRQWIPWNWSYRLLGAHKMDAGNQLGPLEVLLTAESASQHPPRCP